jgi:hypothetical protein
MFFTGSKRRDGNRQGAKTAKMGLGKQKDRNPFPEFLPFQSESL